MKEIDYWRAAGEMMRQHGENAALEAALKADVFLDNGDSEGVRVWKRIVKTINVLEARKPPANENLQ